jgi:iron(III) transport system substrate-binding protein
MFHYELKKGGYKMNKNCRFLEMIWAVGLLVGVLLLMGTFNVAQGKKLPADVEKWLKKNKIGPYQEQKVDYNALYQAAKKEGRVVMYASSSRGPKSLAMGFYDKYPGIKVEWNTLGVDGSITRLLKEQKAGIYNVDLLYASDSMTQVNILYPANMVFPWFPPDLKEVIPRKFREPLVAQRLACQVLFYNLHTWPDKPPVDSWWDLTKPEWKGRLVAQDPIGDANGLNFFATMVINADEMAKDYERVFGKPLKLTTPNAGYEWIKMIFANKPKLIDNPKKARFIGEPGQAKPSLGIAWGMSRITDTDNPKVGKIKYAPHVTLKPRIGTIQPSLLNIAYKAPHPNAAKLLIRWIFGDEKGGGGNAPWFTPGNYPTRTDVKRSAPHPFNPKLSWPLKDLNFWLMDDIALWEKQREVLDFINKQL